MKEDTVQYVKVIKAGSSSYWYASLIGTVLPIIKVVPEGYLAREPAGYINIIYSADAKIIKEEKHVS